MLNSIFSIKTNGKSEFAMMIFPDISDPKLCSYISAISFI